MGERLSDYRGIITGVPERVADGASRYPGLTTTEVLALHAIVSAEGTSAGAVAQSTGLSRSEATRALARLIALGYATRIGDGRRIRYRATARPLVP